MVPQLIPRPSPGRGMLDPVGMAAPPVPYGSQGVWGAVRVAVWVSEVPSCVRERWGPCP